MAYFFTKLSRNHLRSEIRASKQRAMYVTPVSRYFSQSNRDRYKKMCLFHTNNCEVIICTINVLNRTCTYFFDNVLFSSIHIFVVSAKLSRRIFFMRDMNTYRSVGKKRMDHVYSSYARSQDRTRSVTKVASGQCRIPNERSSRLDDDEAVCHT